MATDLEPGTTQSGQSPLFSSQHVAPTVKRTSGGSRFRLLPLVAVAAIAALAVLFTMMRGRDTWSDAGTKLTHTVARGDLRIMVTESGELESANNVDIKCKVAGGSTILWIVEDGTEVKEGDVLVRLDASTIEDSVSQQQITYEKALATFIQAESDLAVAKINVEEYLEGTFRQEMQTAQSNVAVSEENLRVAQNTLAHTEKMFRKGYVSKLELDGQVYAVEHARLQLKLHETAVDVLERFTKPKMLQDLKSKLKAAKAKLSSEKAALELEKVRLERLEKQRDGCEIRAEQAGMVIYPETDEWRDEPAIEEGAAVRESQTILQLPDVNNMQVRVEVHESKVDLLKAGMPASVRIQDEDFTGELVSVANRAEQTSWWAGNIRKFRAIVKLLDHRNAKPGMSASVEITAAEHKDVLSVPVAAVIERDGEHHCWVRMESELKKRPLVLGASNDQFVIVKDGLSEGEDVILNPRAVVEEAQLEALKPVRTSAPEAGNTEASVRS